MVLGDSTYVVANIFISFIGAGVLGLPFAFKQAGLMEGAFVLTLVAAGSVKAMLLLIECKYKCLSVLVPDLSNVRVSDGKGYTPVKNEDHLSDDDDKHNKSNNSTSSTRSNSPGIINPRDGITYSDVAFSALSHGGRYIVDFSLLASQIGFCCGYLVYITKTLSSYWDETKSFWLVGLLPLLFFMTLVPDLNKMAKFSICAQISNLIAFLVVFWFDFEHLHLFQAIKDRDEINVAGLAGFFSVAIYCYEGAGMILSLEHSVPERLKSSFKRLFVVTIIIVTSLYLSFGWCGYLSFGPDTKDLITQNLDPPEEGGRSFWAGLIKICLAIALIFTYPVMLFPVIKVLKPRLEQFCGCTKDSKYVAFGIRFCLVTLTGIIVMEVPNFNSLMSLIGATTCTTLAFIMPGLCHYSLFRNELTKSQMCLDLFLAGFGILLAIVGTYDAVNKYNYPDPNHPHVPPIPIAKSHLVQTAAANSMNSIGS